MGGLQVQASQQSLLTGATGNVLIPNTPPYSGLGSFHVDIRVHNWTQPTGACQFLGFLPSFNLTLCPGNLVRIEDFVDQMTGNFYAAVDVSNRPDFLVRLGRDVTAKQITAEVWNVDGSGYVQSASPIGTVNPLVLPQFAGAGGATAQIAFLRWYSGTVPFGTLLTSTSPPMPGAGGNLADWEFDGNSTDSSGHGLTVNFPGNAASFVPTPVYAPACVVGPFRTIRAGSEVTLDGSLSYPLDGGSTLSYSWKQLPGISPVNVMWSNTTVQKPVITGLLAGQYQFQLRVTDGSGGSSTCTETAGAVVSDSKGVVITGNQTLDNVLGPLIRWGANPWPYYDDRHKYLADFFGGLQATHTDVWDTTLTGTVTLTHGSTTITGVGTSFLSTFACNGTDVIVLYYTHTPPGGVTSQYRNPSTVLSCQSDTQLTISPFWPLATETGRAYSKMSAADLFYWIGNATNTNFYDNVLGFYALYYRSGLEIYRTYARTLADRWWTLPYINQGHVCDGTGQIPCSAPRNRSMSGLIVRALDGRPDMWPGLREWMDNDISLLPIYNNQIIFDLREYSYLVNEVALCAIADPDPTHQAVCQAAVADPINLVYSPQQQPDGSWLNPSLGFSSWNAGTGSVNVTTGSTTVIGIGTNFALGCAGLGFWSKNGLTPPVSNKEGDSGGFTVVSVNSDTSLTISPKYNGLTQTGKGWECNNLLGLGVQPFMIAGVAGRTFNNVYRALATSDPATAAKARKFAVDAWNWTTSKGYWPANEGFFYARTFAGCEPDPRAFSFCAGTSSSATAEGNIQSVRFISAEAMNGCAHAYEFSSNAVIKSVCDILFGALYGGQGGIGADSHYVWGFFGRWDQAGDDVTFDKAKDYGFGYGWGGGSAWPVASMGGVAPVNNRTSFLGFNLAEVPSAAKFRVTLTAPSGVQTVTVCTVSPCGVTVDARLGDYLYQTEYLTSSDVVKARSETAVLSVQ